MGKGRATRPTPIWKEKGKNLPAQRASTGKKKKILTGVLEVDTSTIPEKRKMELLRGMKSEENKTGTGHIT